MTFCKYWYIIYNTKLNGGGLYGDVIHGEARRNQLTPLYNTWRGMKERCLNPNHIGYNNYGGKGIIICEEWQNSFVKFREWALSNGYQEGLTIDRVDTNGNYEPSNCRWSTQKEQQNNKTSNHFLTYNGITMTINQWAEELGVKRELIKDRLRWGWSVEKALVTPVRECKSIIYEFNGESHNLKEWAHILKLPYDTLHYRVHKLNWTIDKALTTPIQKKNKTIQN